MTRRAVTDGMGRAATLVSRCLVLVVLLPVRVYQRTISPLLPPTCRYYPSCSAYAIGAVTAHGPVKGLLLAVWRILRCNPLTPGGIDHVPDRGRWRYSLPRDVARFDVECHRNASE